MERMEEDQLVKRIIGCEVERNAKNGIDELCEISFELKRNVS